MRVSVRKSHERPYENPLRVTAGERIVPDFERTTDIEGWVWCTAPDGRSGWAPRGWLVEADGAWRLVRDYDAIELSVAPGEVLEVVLEESGFYWARKETGETGWVPADHVSVIDRT